MEVLQCDGCDFRAESYDDLKTHIQDVHTAFLQPTEVVDGTPGQSRSESPNSLSHAEEDEEFLSTGTDDAGGTTFFFYCRSPFLQCTIERAKCKCVFIVKYLFDKVKTENTEMTILIIEIKKPIQLF